MLIIIYIARASSNASGPKDPYSQKCRDQLIGFYRRKLVDPWAKTGTWGNIPDENKIIMVFTPHTHSLMDTYVCTSLHFILIHTARRFT